jgi:GMP reductase
MKWTGIPIIAANMTTTGTLDVYKVLSKYKIITALHKFHTLDDLNNYNATNPSSNEKLNPDYFMISTGIGDNDFNNLVNILDNFECNFICIDIANGYISAFKKFCKKVKDKYPHKVIVAGNVCTKEGVSALVSIGIDIIKTGIGGGSACTTRIKTGIGMPQLSCIIESKEGTSTKSWTNLNNWKGSKSYILSDGGITCPGDLGKAFGAGADFVMIGGVFAGHDENPGELIEDNGEKYKFFYGMSSNFAMNNNYAANSNREYRSSEGREIKIKYKGKLDETVNDYLGGLRSTCTYTNTQQLYELEKNCTFAIVNSQFNGSLVGGR